jgi:phosphatidylglycerol---prolipoprotein diacylglyceryl transferase
MDERAKDDRTVGIVETHSPAEKAGLMAGDVIVNINGVDVADYTALEKVLGSDWPRGETKLVLKVKRGDAEQQLPAYTPRLIGLYPTQVYESISAGLLLIALTVTWPFRKYDGQLLVLLMMGYAVHRFVNESLRDDTPKYLFLTLSQWISVGIFTSGLLIASVRRWQMRRATSAK